MSARKPHVRGCECADCEHRRHVEDMHVEFDEHPDVDSPQPAPPAEGPDEMGAAQDAVERGYQEALDEERDAYKYVRDADDQPQPAAVRGEEPPRLYCHGCESYECEHIKAVTFRDEAAREARLRRAVCVRACEGMEDPEHEVNEMRECLREAFGFLFKGHTGRPKKLEARMRRILKEQP